MGKTIPRSIDALTLARMAQVEGMRAVVFKNHFFPTTGIAFLASQYATFMTGEVVSVSSQHP